MQRTISAHSADLPIDHFVISFCENSDLLSQWRAYSEGGGGYSMGFLSSALLAASKREQVDPESSCVLRRVIYQQNQKEEMIRERIKILRTILEPLSSELRWDQDHKLINRIWVQAAASFHPALALMKNPAFEEEREWRFVRTLWKKPVPTADWPVRFRTIRGHLTPYFAVSWALPNHPESEETRGIGQITCGPAMDAALKEKATNDLLAAHNCRSKVSRSTVPLRV
jgi:hypothetical protein